MAKFGTLLFSLASDATEMSLWEELWAYFKEKYMQMDRQGYENLNLSGSHMITLPQIIMALLIGVILASFAAVINKNVLGDFVRTLLQHECHDPDKAKTLEELGYRKNTTIRSSLKRGVNLRRVVHCVEEEAYAAEMAAKEAAFREAHKDDPKAKFVATPFKMDVDTMHFYIHHDEIYMADVKFEKKGTDWFFFAATVIICVAVFFLVIYLLPDLFRFVDNFVGMFKASN